MDYRSGVLARWAMFNGVGLMGVAVQLVVLAALTRAASLPVAVATAIAVEAAVLHNFAWHQRFTWRDRPAAGCAGVLARLLRFHAINGAISLMGNVAITSALAGEGLDPLMSNGIAIMICSTGNFLAGDRVVFTARTSAALCLAGVMLAPLSASASVEDAAGMFAAGPTAAALASWDKYVAAVDARHREASGGQFFALDMRRAANWRERTKTDGVPMIEITPPGAADSKIHHWAGAIYVPNTTVDAVVRRLIEYAGRESEFYQEVKASRLLGRNGDSVRVFMRLERDAGPVTAHFNTEHAVEYRHVSPTRAVSRSVSTKIAEIADAGTPREREKPAGKDHGFLWRLNAYWRFEQAGDGVLIECESVSLSRTVPLLIRPIASPIVNRIARESLERTLRSMRRFLTKQT